MKKKTVCFSLTLFVNSDCGMFGDVLLIFHDTSKLNLGTFLFSGRGKFMCNIDFWTTAAFQHS